MVSRQEVRRLVLQVLNRRVGESVTIDRHYGLRSIVSSVSCICLGHHWQSRLGANALISSNCFEQRRSLLRDLIYLDRATRSRSARDVSYFNVEIDRVSIYATVSSNPNLEGDTNVRFSSINYLNPLDRALQSIDDTAINILY